MGDSLDLLSAALDESGITGCDLEFDSGFDDSLLALQTTAPAMATENAQQEDSSPSEDQCNLDQVDMFTHALKQMATTSHFQPIQTMETETDVSVANNSKMAETTAPSPVTSHVYNTQPSRAFSNSSPAPPAFIKVATPNTSSNPQVQIVRSQSLIERPRSPAVMHESRNGSLTYVSSPKTVLNTATGGRTVIHRPGTSTPMLVRNISGSIPAGARVISLKPVGKVVPSAAPDVSSGQITNTATISPVVKPNNRVSVLNSAIAKLNASSLTNAQRMAALNALTQKLNSIPGQGNIQIKIIQNSGGGMSKPTTPAQTMSKTISSTPSRTLTSPHVIKLTAVHADATMTKAVRASPALSTSPMPLNMQRVVIHPAVNQNGSSIHRKQLPVTVGHLNHSVNVRPFQPVIRPTHSVIRPYHSNLRPMQSIIRPFQSVVPSDGLPPNSVFMQHKQPLVSNVKLTDKDVSRMWSNEDVVLKSVIHKPQLSQGVKQFVEDDVEEEVDELGRAETYFEYMPQKLKIGEKHPDPVVETSSLSSVEPPNIWYRLAIPEEIIDCGNLSALQLESIVYASQRHETILTSKERAGFLIGDGAGVGKGRTIAGIIFENYLLGRKRAIWLSVSSDLKVDAERDLHDIGAGKIEVYALNKFKYAKISARENGSVKKGVVFATYSSLIGESHSEGKYRTRFKQLLHWCGHDFDGLIIFDECHKAKNLCPVGSTKPTKTGQTVLELQNKLPGARVVYASATGASEPKNMAYMTRLGLWGAGTPFNEFTDFIQAVEKRGVGAMELVAMEIKLRGMYIARQLSFHGVTFRVEDMPLMRNFVKMYNEAVKLWVDAREKFQQAAELIDAEHRMKKSMWGQFWSAHQRFFKYLCISAKVDHCVKLAREAVKNGKCVVIGLQSTGEARTLEQVEEMGGELNDFVSTAKGVFQTLVEKHFPAPDRRKTVNLINAGSRNGSKPGSPVNGKRKRKKDIRLQNATKRARKSSFGSSAASDTSESGHSGGSDDEANSDSSSSEEEEEEEKEDEDSYTDSFNPFAGDSDSDDDPWLKKMKSPKANKAKVRLPKEKKVKKKKVPTATLR